MKALFISQSKNYKVPFLIVFINIALVLVLFSILFYASLFEVGYEFDWTSIYEYRNKFIQGFFTTILISISALALSVIFGLLLAFGQSSFILPIKYFCRVVVEIIRGTPLLVQILVFFYLVSNAFGLDNRYIAGVLIIALFSGSYLSEVFRGGLESISSSQLESAKAIGLTSTQTYIYIVFPQIFKRVLPALAGQLASLIKDSSLLSIISIREFTMNAQEVNAYTYSTLESYIPLAIGYFILTFPLSIVSRILEKKYSYEY